MTTPIAPLALPKGPLAPRRVAADVLAAVLPGPGRDRLAQGEVLVVTTGQQPGLFTGPLYTIYKALSAIAFARRLERERRTPVVPVFWVAGEDHDFAEANHTWFLNASGEPARIVLRERPPEAALRPLFREPCGPEIAAALQRLRVGTPDSEFKAGVVDWLEQAYRPDANLADAFAQALAALLGPRGLAVFCAHHPAAKRAAAPWVLKGLAHTLPDGLTPVMVEADAGRDRLRVDGERFVTRRSGERFSPTELAARSLSPNVLLRPVVESALFPSVAYAAGPAELEYWKEAAPLYEALGVPMQTPVPRWSGVLIEARVDKVLQKYGLGLADFDGSPPPGALEARLARAALPPETGEALARLRALTEQEYARLAQAAAAVDPTLARTVETTRNAALVALQDVEKKLVASLKRGNETLAGQIARARAALAPTGQPQERVLTLASFLIRYGSGLVDAVEAEVARWADVS